MVVIELELTDGMLYDEGEREMAVERALKGRINVKGSRCYRRYESELSRRWTTCRLVLWCDMLRSGQRLGVEVVDGFGALKVGGYPFSTCNSVKGVEQVEESWLDRFQRDNKTFERVW